MLSALGAWYILLATPHGIGLTYDSMSYLAGARSLHNGQGYAIPALPDETDRITWFPPIYSAFLACCLRLSGDVFQTARVLNALVFGLNILVIGLWCRRLTPSWAIPLGAACAWMLSPDMVVIHCMAWSEGLFLLFAFAGLFALDVYVEGTKIAALIFAGILLAAANLTRFAGLSLLPTAIIIIILRSKRRARDVSIFAMLSGIPIAAWLLRNYFIDTTIGGRHAGLNSGAFAPLLRRQTLRCILGWVFPNRLITFLPSGMLWGSLCLLLAGFLTWLVWTQRKKSVAMPACFGLLYLLQIGLASLFLQANLLTEAPRILAPLHSALFLALLGFLSAPLTKSRITAGAVLLYAGLEAAALGSYTAEFSHDGFGFASRMWTNSETLARISRFPRDQLIYATECAPISLYDQRPCEELPAYFAANKGVLNKDYESAIKEAQNDIRERNGILVEFHPRGNSYINGWLFGGPAVPVRDWNSVLSHLHMQIDQTYTDGKIYIPQNS